MMRTATFITLLLSAGFSEAAAEGISYNRDVRPILAAKCFACHGPDEEAREADLRLDLRSDHFDAKEILHRITTADPDDVMPPPTSPKPLTDQGSAILRQWIDGGANYEQHWSFQPVRRPETRGGIDELIRAELKKHQLSPAPRAAPATLIRRVFLDLTGLPPTPADLSDLTDEKYEYLVDHLLASPHFGERWGRHWLDMARYADSHGFLGDGLRPNAYHYRDWVIRAFNEDLPYDEFTVQQIAGDLLPESEPTATGFHRNAALNTEAGVDKEEARYQNLVDRVNTTARVWMGLSIGCAQCHTHKYDPITINDYYSLYAFFDNTEDRDDAKTKAPTLAEVGKDRRQTYVHLAGDYTRRGPDVQPATLSAFPAQTGPTRLDLAKWIVSPENPLTARVAVNHVWSKLFGEGLVRTPDDFGTSGESPSHPELLDWLAGEFVQNGWSRKQLIKLIVMSETYRRTSFPTRLSDANELENSFYVDPLNRLLSHQNRIRLDAEILRDSALAISGLLERSIGGPSFRPPLPEDVFDVGRSSNWQASPAPERYRRSLYIITLRSVLHPLLTTFDGPDAADACVRRERSNTPLQALTMMNDETYVEAARALARRVLQENPGETPEHLAALFQLVLNRPPRAEELARLQAFHSGQKRRVQTGGGEALKILGSIEPSLPAADVIEAATLVATARVLMNLDEFINRE